MQHYVYIIFLGIRIVQYPAHKSYHSENDEQLLPLALSPLYVYIWLVLQPDLRLV